MPDELISFVFSLFLALGAVFYVAFLRDRYSALHTAAVFSLSTAIAVAVLLLIPCGTAVAVNNWLPCGKH